MPIIEQTERRVELRRVAAVDEVSVARVQVENRTIETVRPIAAQHTVRN